MSSDTILTVVIIAGIAAAALLARRRKSAQIAGAVAAAEAHGRAEATAELKAQLANLVNVQVTQNTGDSLAELPGQATSSAIPGDTTNSIPVLEGSEALAALPPGLRDAFGELISLDASERSVSGDSDDDDHGRGRGRGAVFRRRLAPVDPTRRTWDTADRDPLGDHVDRHEARR